MLEFMYLKTGSNAVNELLDCGFERGAITTVIGHGGTGKTSVLLDTAFHAIKEGMKGIYIDAEDGTNIKRLIQLAKASGIILSIPDVTACPTVKQKTEKTRIEIIAQLEKRGFYYKRASSFPTMIREIRAALQRIDLDFLVVDSITYQYVATLCNANDQTRLTTLKELSGIMIGTLADLHKYAIEKEVAVAITAQEVSEVTSMLKDKGTAQMVTQEANGKEYVGGKSIEHSSKVVMQLFKTDNPRMAKLIKHRNQDTGTKFVKFKIFDGGICDIEGIK